MKIPSPVTNQVRPSSQSLIGTSPEGATPEAFGAGIGRGLTRVAQGTLALATKVEEQDLQRRRFDALRQMSQFQTDVNKRVFEMQRSAPADQSNFLEVAIAEYHNMEADFLNQLDPEFQGEFSTRTAAIRQGLADSALTFQYAQTDSWFRQGIDEAFQGARVDLQQNATPEEFDLQFNNLMDMISASGLTDAEKLALARQVKTGLSGTLYRQEQVRLLTEEDQAGGATGAAAALISASSGGTEEEALQAARAGEQAAVQAIGSVDAWARLPSRVRAAIISATVAGELPEGVVNAARAGDLEKVSEELREAGMQDAAELVLDPGATIDNDERYSHLPLEDRIALRADAQAQVNAARTAQEKAATEHNDAIINALMVGLFDGTAGVSEIETLREQGILTDIEDIEKAYKIYNTRNEGVDLTQQGLAILNSGGTFNPTDENHQKIQNAMVGEDGKKRISERDSEYVANFLVPMVSQGQDIPTDVVGQLMGMIRSNNQTNALWALDTLSQLEQASPDAFNHRTTEAVASQVNFWRTRKDFYEPDQLLSMINGGLTTEERRNTELLREQAQSVLNDPKINVRSVLLGHFRDKGWFGGAVFGQGTSPAAMPTLPWASRGITADFDRLFEDQYALYGNVEEAQAAALSILDRVWGVTEVNGTATVMKFPPEKLYPQVAGGYTWMGDQVRSEGLILPDEGFELLSDAQTEAEVDAFRRGGPPPSYVLIRIKDGQPSLVPQSEMLNGFAEKYGPEAAVELAAEISGKEGLPVRQFFSITEAERAKEAQWRVERQRIQNVNDALDALANEQEFSMETGLPIPADSEGSIGLREFMMFESEEEARAAAGAN